MDKGAIRKESYDIYCFGFQTAMEMVSCIVVSLFIALKMHMVLEYAIFLGIFILVRSYAGGLHLDSFWACFFCSCVVQSGVLLAAKNYQLSKIASLIIILSMVLMIKIIKPRTCESTVGGECEEIFSKKIEYDFKGNILWEHNFVCCRWRKVLVFKCIDNDCNSGIYDYRKMETKI